MNVFKRSNFSKGCEDSLLYTMGTLSGWISGLALTGIAYVVGWHLIPYLENVLIPNAILKPLLKEEDDFFED